MTTRTTTNDCPMLAAAVLMAAAAPAMAQDAQPMLLSGQNRGNWVELEDPFWGIEPHYGTHAENGVWIDSAEIGTGGAQGLAMQWTRIDDEYLGGFLSSEMSSWGGFEESSGSNMWAEFELERTARLEATATFGGSFAMDLGEAYAVVKLYRVNEDGQILEHVVDWSHYGTSANDANRDEWSSRLVNAGLYRFYAEVQTNVRGVEIGPDFGRMELFTSISIDRLPGCGEPGAGSCDEAKDTPSCDDATCCTRVCEVDPYCCDNHWDAICVGEAADECGPCPGDLNGDGAVNGADQGLLFAAWGPHSPAYIHPADLNADGTVDGVDLGILFSLWGDC